MKLHRLVVTLCAVVTCALPAKAGLAGLNNPALLLVDGSGSPEQGQPITLQLTVVSQVAGPASFLLELSAPPDVALGTESFSGALAGNEERTIRVDAVPDSLGDFRLEARLHFTPEGALNPFLVKNGVVLRVRDLPQQSGVFVDQGRWSKSRHDEIKDAKIKALDKRERDERLGAFGRAPELSAVSEDIIARQQQYRLAATQGVSSNELLALKASFLGSDRIAHLGSAERFENTDGLVLRGLPVSYVYLERFELDAGQTYRFETRNLSLGSDTVAVLLARNTKTGELNEVARNDDAELSTLASRIEYSPKSTGEFLLIIRSYSPQTRGECDVYFNEQFLERTRFGGLAVSVTSDAGDVLQSVGMSRVPNRTDPWMLITGSRSLWDDDGGMELGARLVMPDLTRQELILGASSSSLEGTVDLVLNTADGSAGNGPRGDLDGDGLSNELERALGTQVDAQDTDGDGLLDGWEVLGVRDTDYPGLGASGVVPDVFVQIDWMMTETHNHQPRPDALQIIIDSFAATGLNLHVDDGREEEGGEGHLLPDPWTHIDFLSLSGIFFDIRAANFADKRVGIYHYNIFAHRQPSSCSSGVSQIRGSNFLVTLGCAAGQIGSTFDQAGTFMHELGHNLGLRHGGFQDLNYKPNYRSVMNYLFQFPGTCGRVGFIRGVTYAPCSSREYFYSFGGAADLDENCLDETVGIGEGSIDWNEDGVFDTCVMADINYPRLGQPDRRFDLLRDYDDYSNLFLMVSGGARPSEEEIVTCAPPPAP